MASEPVRQNGSEATVGDKNVEAKADVDDLLAQLQAKSAATAPAPEKAEADKADDTKEVEATNGAEEKAEKKGEDDTYRGERRNRDEQRERQDYLHEDRKSFSRGGGGRGRGRGGGGRGGFKDKRNNNRFDPSTQGESDDPVAIRKQVEFYFSDSNLPLDKFLLTQVGGVENNPVDLDVICSFKRMRHFQPREAVVKALKESTFLNLVEDDTKIQRKTPLPAEFADGAPETVVKVFEDRAMPRSIYVKGFGEEQPSTQFDIEAFFAPYGPTNAIRLRRKDHDRSFKGSVFVEFDSEETMKKFLDLDPKPDYQDHKLQIMTKKEYCDQKAADIASGKIRASSPSGGGGASRKRTRDDNRDWRDRRADDSRGDRHRDGRRNGGGRGHGSRGGRGDRDRDNNRRGGNRDRDRDRDGDKDKVRIDRDAANAEAVAKAKAFVEAENAKEAEAATATTSTTDKDTKSTAETLTTTTAAAAAEPTQGQKRPRDEGGEAEAEAREPKKVDVKEA